MISCKWLLNLKDGIPEVESNRYKARHVVRRFDQRKGINFNEVFSSVVRRTYIRVLLSIVALQDLELEQLDVKTAFLHGHLEEEIYVEQPEGFKVPGKEDHVCILKKLLYDLKQSHRQWYKMFDSFMIGHGYDRCGYDEYGVKDQLSNEFDTKDLGAAKRILGMEIQRDRKIGKLTLSQTDYISKVLKKFKMSSCKPVPTPLAPHFKLSSHECPKSDKDKEDMSRVPYSSAVGSLIVVVLFYTQKHTTSKQLATAVVVDDDDDDRKKNGLIDIPGNANQNGNGNLVAARAEGNAAGHNDLDEIKEVNANCILMSNLQQASTSGTQTDKALVYDSDGSAEDITCGTSANTKFAKQSILGKPPKVGKTYDLSKPVTSNSILTPQGSKVMKNDKVIAPGMFRINPFKPSREEKHVPNKVRASVRTNPITVSQPPVITKKVVNSDSNGLSSTGVDNTKTRRPQPRINTKNDRVPSVCKSSCSKNKEVDVEEHHRKLLLFRNKKHMSSEYTNIKLASQNVN
nr:retrovirus-related Pol polyprotein from transposon TNT 1-94 [Tanacetum cinerariifolium]